MKHRFVAIGVAAVAAITVTLSACSGGGSGSPSESKGPITITMSAWDPKTFPEFQALADGFHKAHPGVTVEVKAYDNAQYATLLTADLAAGSAPDVLPLKDVTSFVSLQTGGQLLDVSDVKIADGVQGAGTFKVAGKQYGIPYRNDYFVLYYNKDLLDKAGVAYPDGTWTWNDYSAAAAKLGSGLKSAGSDAKPVYEHSWPIAQVMATAQAPNADLLRGDYSYMKRYYGRELQMQADGLQTQYNTVTANHLTYQGEFGKEKAALMVMGSWYVSTLVGQQASGDAASFAWGIAPVPQYNGKTAGPDGVPVSTGDASPLAVNAKIDSSKISAAKEFLAYASGEKGAKALASMAISSALVSDAVSKVYRSVKGVPSDKLTDFTLTHHKIVPQNPASPKTPATQTLLAAMHTAIMSGSESIDKAISDADAAFENQVGR